MADRYIPEHRRTTFKAKNLLKPDELRRRREEQQVEIRKQKREENLAKRRGITRGDEALGASLGAAPDSDDESTTIESQVRFTTAVSSVPVTTVPSVHAVC
jgi:importin subunit alpha-1